MKTIRHSLALLTSAFFASAVAHAGSFVDQRRIEPIHGDAAAGAAKAITCVACHGPNGNAIVPTFPRLAGQHATYLYQRLLEFKHADSKSPYYSASPMPTQVAALSDTDMRNLAAHFAAQTPTSSLTAAGTKPGDRGEHLFYEGDPEHGIPPCQGCHGADARGPVPGDGRYAAYPSLRGQQAPYLVTRLRSYRGNQPQYGSNNFIMHGVAHSLDDESIQAIATWLASLPPAEK